ncbi:MAG TPA: hypothetical protein VF982_09860 [Anaerolineales bacterium]
MTTKRNSGRSTLTKAVARQRYVEIGEDVVLEQIQKDSGLLDRRAVAVGPFARLDASSVSVRDGKTRGAITNLFGSQAAFQAETMALALGAGHWIEDTTYPDPADFPTADAWVDAFFAGQSARGPQHGTKPTVNYAFLWALWLSVVPYGLWSKRISGPSLDEQGQWLKQLEGVFRQALDHFGITLREGTTLNDLVYAVASLIEGVWLNQCLTTRHPGDPSQPISFALCRSGRLLWLGATAPPALGE